MAHNRQTRLHPLATPLLNTKPKAVCLFSSAGIGELGVRASGIEIICANEIVPYRAAVYHRNFPEHQLVEGDLRVLKDDIIRSTLSRLNGEELFLVYATPPCQGMSTNGMGRLKWEIESGRRHEEDERNRLIIPTLEVIQKLNPKWVIFENVPGMRYTEIRLDDGKSVNIIDHIFNTLGDEYVGNAQVIACEDFGVPQRRRRLVTVLTRDPAAKLTFLLNGGTFFTDDMKEKRITLFEAIGHLPELDARPNLNSRKDYNRYHYVNVLSEEKYWWIANTPEGDTAFNNQCVAPQCHYQGNKRQRDVNQDGKWTSSKDTPIYCERCESLLPRPVVRDKNGNVRLLKGFHSAYRRMKWGETARAITQNFIYEASDNKVHPTQNRVLSVLEAMIIQTVDRYEFEFSTADGPLSTARIAEVLGESVPPLLIEKICRAMLDISLRNPNACAAENDEPTASVKSA